jgi:hypothetical protein
MLHFQDSGTAAVVHPVDEVMELPRVAPTAGVGKMKKQAANSATIGWSKAAAGVPGCQGAARGPAGLVIGNSS